MDITYTLSLTVTRPVVDSDVNGNLKDVAEWMVGTEAKREIEREVLRALRTLDGDCDIEVMGTERQTTQAEDDAERGDPREKGDDDGREYGDPRDYRSER